MEYNNQIVMEKKWNGKLGRQLTEGGPTESGVLEVVAKFLQ